MRLTPPPCCLLLPFSRMSLDIVQRFNDMYQPIHTRIFVDLVARIEARLASQEDKPDAKASDGRDASGAKAKGALTAAEMVELYQTAFDIAIHSMRAGNACGASGLNWLSDKLEWELVGYLNEPCLVKLNAAKEAGAIALLREWIVRWKAFEIFMRTVASVFAPCGEGTFSVPYNKRPPSEIGPILFHKIIFTPTVHPLSRAVLALIDRHRAGEDVDTMLVARAVQVVVELGFGIHKADSPDRAVFLSLELYRKHIERGFIEAVGAHYDAACAVALQEGTVSEFLIKCSQIVDKERQRVHSYLHRSTLVPLTACLHKCLIKDNVATLLTRKDGLPQFLAEDSRADLARLYDLVKDPQASTGGSGMAGAAAGSSSSSSSVGSSGSAHASQAGLGSCVGRLLMCFQDEVEATGSALLAAEAKDPNRCVDSVLKLRERFVRVIRECFQDNDTAKVHLRSAFERFINKSDKLAMPLAQYAHKMLERGGQLTAQSVENVVSLYGYFRDKDVFEHEYKVGRKLRVWSERVTPRCCCRVLVRSVVLPLICHLFLTSLASLSPSLYSSLPPLLDASQKNLAERLIKGSSSNESDEKEVITRFKAQSGYQWGTDLETMFGDVASSKTYTADYNNVVGEAARRFDFTAHICSGSSWPIGPAPPAIIPAELKDAPATFESIYLNKVGEGYLLRYLIAHCAPPVAHHR